MRFVPWDRSIGPSRDQLGGQRSGRQRSRFLSPEQLTDRFIAGTTLLQNRPDGLLHFRRRVLLMQLQHLDELTGSRAFSLAVPQRLEQDLVIRRPLRPPLDDGTSTFKCPHALVDQIQIMERIDLPVGTTVQSGSDDRMEGHDYRGSLERGNWRERPATLR